MGVLDTMNNTVTMLQVVERLQQPATSLRDIFFPNPITFPTQSVLIDYKKSGRRVAPIVKDGFGRGVNVARDPFERVQYTPPMMAPQRPLTRDLLIQPGVGETMYSSETPENRALKIRKNDLVELRDMIINREEQMIAEFLTRRAFTVKGYVDDGKNYQEEEIQFPGENIEQLTGASAWNQPTSDPIEDIQRIENELIQYAPVGDLIAIVSPNVATLLRNNEKVQKILDNRRMMYGELKPSISSEYPGMMFIGKLSNTEIYSYASRYINEDGESVAFIPDNFFIMGVKGRGRRLYGAITQLEANDQFVTYQGLYVPKRWNDLGGDVSMLRLGSRYLPAPESAEDFYTLIVK